MRRKNVFVFRVAGPKATRYTSSGDQLRRDLGHKVGALLAGEAGNDTRKGAVHRLRGQAEFLQQLRLQIALPLRSSTE